MSRKASTAPRSKTVARSSATGRFVKASTAKRSPSTTVIENVAVPVMVVEVARSAATGRFVKKDTARRHPDKTLREKVRR